jgi:hypothetical protein
VRLPEPEKATPGVPGGPCTSPAKAAPALSPATTAAQIATANLLRMSLPFLPPCDGLKLLSSERGVNQCPTVELQEESLPTTREGAMPRPANELQTDPLPGGDVDGECTETASAAGFRAQAPANSREGRCCLSGSRRGSPCSGEEVGGGGINAISRDPQTLPQ